MATEPDPIRYRNGVVEIDDQELVFRKSPGPFLASQRALWRSDRLRPRMEAVLNTLVAVLLPVAAIWYVYLAVLSDTWYATGLYSQTMWAAIGLLFAFQTWERFRSIRVPLERLDDGVIVASDRSIRVSREAFGWFARFRSWGLNSLKITFVGQAHRDRAVALLEEHGVEVVESDDHEPIATRAEYKFFRKGGGYFCPACDAQVSPGDPSCAECGEVLSKETRHEEGDRSAGYPGRGADL